MTSGRFAAGSAASAEPATAAVRPPLTPAEVVAELHGYVLEVAWRVLTWLGIPGQVLVLVISWQRGIPVHLLLVELLALAAIGAGVPLLTRRRMAWQEQLFLWAFGAYIVAALLQFGLVFAVGLFYVFWLLIAVFFMDSALRAILSAMALFGTFVGLRALGFNVGSAGIPGELWVTGRVALSIFAATMGLAVTFHTMMRRLGDALRQEADARERAARAHAEREANLQAMSHLQRMESLGRLAGGIAHDFNNALALLVMGVEELREPALTNEDRDVVLGDMERALKGATATTAQVLAFARQGSAPGQTARVSTVVEGMATGLRRLLPETLNVRTVLMSAGTIGMGTGELEQALLNLALNARDAMTAGGTLTLGARDVVAEDGSSWVDVTVQDTGDGMPEEVRRQAFDPFFTTKGAHAGTGLGLAMVAGQVHRAGGQITIDSAIGVGTTVRMRLPVVVARSGPHAAVANGGLADELGNRGRVLYVEDAHALRYAMTRALLRAGYDVTATESRADAMRAIKESAGLDFLLTDAVLRDGASLDVITRFEERFPGRPILLISGYVPNGGLIEGIALDRVEFLQKPFDIRTLLTTMDRLALRADGIVAPG